MNKIPSATTSTGNAITPLDGRNYHKISNLSDYFSEYSLVRYRVRIELEYLVHLERHRVIPKLSQKEKGDVAKILKGFGPQSFLEVKEIEKKTNHDIKAVEYFLKLEFLKSGLSKFGPFLHLCLTSEDVNNLAYALILKDFKVNILMVELKSLLSQLQAMAKKYKSISMLARTHGQPAVTTTIGKELANYHFRLAKQYKKLSAFDFEGKLNGAVGNLSVNKIVLPQFDWLKISREFVTGIGLVHNPYTTQILFYDNWLEFFQIVQLVNGILLDLSVNVWQMIMLNTFVLRKKEDEVGSSTMPQKVNPINFEHAEGNLGLANSMLEFFVRKLTSSRLQRDLSDSTIRRNFGEAMGYSILGWKSVATGLGKLEVNRKHLESELDSHWEILSEAIQTALRIRLDDDAYEKLKKMTRGTVMDKKLYMEILRDLGLSDDKKLNDLTPGKYVGFAEELVDKLII